MSINHVCISGNLTRAPELRQTQGGTSILSFGVAVNERRKNARGEWEDYANFVDCVMFGQRAESVSKFLAKGMKVAVNGRLHYNSWEKDGQRRSKIEVVVDDIEFMSRGQQQPQQQRQPQQQPQPQQRYQQQGGYQQQSYQQQDTSPYDMPF